MSPIILLREKDTLLQKSGLFRFAQTLIARPKGRASRDDFSPQTPAGFAVQGGRFVGDLCYERRKDIQMGQRMDEPDIVYGYDCTLGEGFDPPLWEHGKTPKYVYARFSNVKKCTKDICVPYPSPPNDRVFKLEQWSVNHCYWIYDSEWWLRWRLHLPYPINSQLTLTKGVVGPHYFDQTFHPNAVPAWCFHNELDCELPAVCGYDGIGIITWGVKARAILEDLNIGLDYKLFMEMRPIENCMQVFKFCRVQDGTNITIKYDPD